MNGGNVLAIGPLSSIRNLRVMDLFVINRINRKLA
jgi:hypothetical protein